MVKGQGHTYLELVYGSNARSSFIFWPSVNIFAIIIAHHVQITTKVSEYGYDLEIKGQNQIFLTTVTLLIIQKVRVQTPLWRIHGMCSYLVQQVRMMCRLNEDFS